MLSYLQLNQGETTTSTNFAVILDGRASDDRPQLVDGTGSDGSSLGLSDGTTTDLLRGLFLAQSRYMSVFRSMMTLDNEKGYLR